MAYWLMKSEPHVYGWDDLAREGRTRWDGVRNHAARANLAAMRVGDEALFYHSNVGRACVGVMRIVAPAAPDPTAAPDALARDGANPWLAVMVEPLYPLPRPVTLEMVKAAPRLRAMALVRLQRLSVQPVTPQEWHAVMALAGA